MAIQHIKNVRIAGISAAVPKAVKEMSASAEFTDAEAAEKFMQNVGIERRHVHETPMCTSDLCQAAAEKLLSETQTDLSEIDMLVFISQNQDYVLPATACVLHGKLGLNTSCCCFDISLGCSGWAYGLSVVGSMMQNGGFRKALMLAGDIKFASGKDESKPLFGDAGTATLLEYNETASEMIVETRTDGTGYEAIIRRGGASRHPFDAHSYDVIEDKHGNRHTILDTEMDGAAVFVFGITKVPKAVKDMLKLTGKTVQDVDYFLFHQANLMMNEQIRKKLKIEPAQCPYSLRDFGNNSSASIPLTIVTQIREAVQAEEKDIIACGFGVGLSWGTVSVRLQKPVIPALVEL